MDKAFSEERSLQDKEKLKRGIGMRGGVPTRKGQHRQRDKKMKKEQNIVNRVAGELS